MSGSLETLGYTGNISGVSQILNLDKFKPLVAEFRIIELEVVNQASSDSGKSQNPKRRIFVRYLTGILW